MWIRDAGDKRAGAERPDSRNGLEPFTHAVLSMPGKDASISFQDLTSYEIELRRQRHETVAGFGRDTLVLALSNQRQQLVDTVAPDTGDNTELGEVSANRVDQ